MKINSIQYIKIKDIRIRTRKLPPLIVIHSKIINREGQAKCYYSNISYTLSNLFLALQVFMLPTTIRFPFHDAIQNTIMIHHLPFSCNVYNSQYMLETAFEGQNVSLFFVFSQRLFSIFVKRNRAKFLVSRSSFSNYT